MAEETLSPGNENPDKKTDLEPKAAFPFKPDENQNVSSITAGNDVRSTTPIQNVHPHQSHIHALPEFRNSTEALQEDRPTTSISDISCQQSEERWAANTTKGIYLSAPEYKNDWPTNTKGIYPPTSEYIERATKSLGGFYARHSIRSEFCSLRADTKDGCAANSIATKEISQVVKVSSDQTLCGHTAVLRKFPTRNAVQGANANYPFPTWKHKRIYSPKFYQNSISYCRIINPVGYRMPIFGSDSNTAPPLKRASWPFPSGYSERVVTSNAFQPGQLSNRRFCTSPSNLRVENVGENSNQRLNVDPSCTYDAAQSKCLPTPEVPTFQDYFNDSSITNNASEENLKRISAEALSRFLSYREQHSDILTAKMLKLQELSENDERFEKYPTDRFLSGYLDKSNTFKSVQPPKAADHLLPNKQNISDSDADMEYSNQFLSTDDIHENDDANETDVISTYRDMETKAADHLLPNEQDGSDSNADMEYSNQSLSTDDINENDGANENDDANETDAISTYHDLETVLFFLCKIMNVDVLSWDNVLTATKNFIKLVEKNVAATNKCMSTIKSFLKKPCQKDRAAKLKVAQAAYYNKLKTDTNVVEAIKNLKRLSANKMLRKQRQFKVESEVLNFLNNCRLGGSGENIFLVSKTELGKKRKNSSKQNVATFEMCVDIEEEHRLKEENKDGEEILKEFLNDVLLAAESESSVSESSDSESSVSESSDSESSDLESSDSESCDLNSDSESLDSENSDLESFDSESFDNSDEKEALPSILSDEKEALPSVLSDEKEELPN